MKKEYDIELPEQNIKPQEIEARYRGMFNMDYKNGGILAKVLIFAYLHEPTTITEVTRKLNDYYKEDHDRANIYRTMKKLEDKNLLHRATIGYVFTIPESEQTDMHKKIINKYHHFLTAIPVPFRKAYTDMTYYWVSNGEGMKYVEWCCKILNFKFKKIKK